MLYFLAFVGVVAVLCLAYTYVHAPSERGQ